MKSSGENDGVLSNTVLVIDDNDLFRAALVRTFEDLGYAVVDADNGLTGLRALGDIRDPSIVFVDLIMPLMDGFAFIEAARQEHPDLPIVVISGVGGTDEAMRAIRLGAWDFISKPLNNLDLLRMVTERNIERSVTTRANREYKAFLEKLAKTRSLQLEEALSRERLAQEGVRRCEVAYRDAFLRHPTPSLLFDAVGGHVLEANEALLLLLDLSREEVLGQPAGRVCPALSGSERDVAVAQAQQADPGGKPDDDAADRSATTVSWLGRTWRLRLRPLDGLPEARPVLAAFEGP